MYLLDWVDNSYRQYLLEFMNLNKFSSCLGLVCAIKDHLIWDGITGPYSVF